ncbi:hypothetical protein STAFG_6401 [Streptomyces afghaniensis 772]|uniref:Uncharacterized protein n=1 Tax=Streptomyces afghaniensis 772 TaxID=1283301 RepID=S4MLR4_9ACTN|nr:hypothetical protein STAFG_6401 [Streptomyces afghaniensis 772]
MAAPFVMLGVLLLLSSGVAVRSPEERKETGEARRSRVRLRRKSDI